MVLLNHFLKSQQLTYPTIRHLNLCYKGRISRLDCLLQPMANLWWYEGAFWNTTVWVVAEEYPEISPLPTLSTSNPFFPFCCPHTPHPNFFFSFFFPFSSFISWISHWPLNVLPKTLLFLEYLANPDSKQIVDIFLKAMIGYCIRYHLILVPFVYVFSWFYSWKMTGYMSVHLF